MIVREFGSFGLGFNARTRNSALAQDRELSFFRVLANISVRSGSLWDHDAERRVLLVEHCEEANQGERAAVDVKSAVKDQFLKSDGIGNQLVPVDPRQGNGHVGIGTCIAPRVVEHPIFDFEHVGLVYVSEDEVEERVFVRGLLSVYPHCERIEEQVGRHALHDVDGRDGVATCRKRVAAKFARTG